MRKNIIITIIASCLIVSLYFNLRNGKKEIEDSEWHPYPMEVVVSEVVDSVAQEPKIKVCMVKWTDGEFKELYVMFKEENNVWRFGAIQPLCPDGWSVEKFEAPDFNEAIEVPVSKTQLSQDSKAIKW